MHFTHASKTNRGDRRTSNSVDISSADMIAELQKTLTAAQIELHFAEMKDPVREKFKRFELIDVLGANIFHPTIGAAIENYLEKYNIEWKN